MIRAVVLAVLVSVPSVATAWELRVVGDTHLSVNAAAAGTIAQLSGSLRDELDRGVAHRAIEISIRSTSSPAQVDRKLFTDARGAFAVSEELPPGEYVATVLFPPEAHLSGSQATASIKLVPASVDVSIVVPPLVVGRDAPVLAYARASSAGVPLQTDGMIQVNGANLQSLSLDPSGRGSADVLKHVRPGENSVVLTIPGSAYRDAARAEARFRWEPELSIDAVLEPGLERLSRGLVTVGTVTGSQGPVPQVRVQAVFIPVKVEGQDDPRTAMTVFAQTDEQGAFRAFASDLRLGGGAWRAVVKAVPPVGPVFERALAENTLEASHTRGFLNAVGFLALFAGVAFLALRGLTSARDLWLKARERRVRSKEREQAFEVDARLVPHFLPLPDARPPSNVVGGLTWDEWRKRPLAGATVTLRGAGERTMQSDARGHFEFRDVPNGEWDVWIDAEGFVRGHLQIRVPHDGRFGAMRLDAVAVPLKIRRMYQAALETRRGEDPWGRLSPREIEMEILRTLDLEVDVAPGSSVSEVIAEITRAVEVSYFSGRRFDEAFWKSTRELILRWTHGEGRG